MNVIEQSPRGYAEELAKVAGYANGGGLKKPLKDESRDFESLDGLVQLVKHLFPDQEMTLLQEFSKTLNVNKELSRYMLEYLSCNRLLESMDQLLTRMEESSNKTSREWAKVYRLQYQWQTEYYNIEPMEILEKINSINTDVPELKTLLNVMTCNVFYRDKNYKVAYKLYNGIKQGLIQIKELYIRKALTVKSNEIAAYLFLRVQDKPEEAREKALEVLSLNVGDTFNAYANYVIGCSYFYTSFEKANQYLNLSKTTYEKIGRTEAKNDIIDNIEKLEILWNKTEDRFFVTYENKLFNMIKNGNDVTEQLEANKGKINEAFYNYLMGLVKNDTNLLTLSMIQYSKKGDSFWARLPMIELKKNGVHEMLLNELLKFNAA